MDDFSPLIISRNTDVKEHRRIVAQVDEIFEEEAATDGLSWDPATEGRIDLQGKEKQSAKILRIMLNYKLDFQPHIDARTKKAKSLMNFMNRLGNVNGSLSARALRSLYTGAVRPIFAWGAELWNGPHTPTTTREIDSIVYQCIRKITGGYHGSSKQKLGYIGGVELLQAELDAMSVTWAARSLRTGDPFIKELTDTSPSPGCTNWHDGTGEHGWTTDSAISSTMYLSPIPSPQAR